MNALVSAHPSSATQQIARVPSRDAVNQNPYVRLWKGLKPIITEAGSLSIACQHATTLVKLVDRAPRHDTYLVGEKWFGVAMGAAWGAEWSVETARRQLRRSIEAIETARGAIKGQFRGETKVKTEDALTRHLAEAQRLLGTFEKLESAPQSPYQPYFVRQKCLSSMLLQIGILLDLMTPLRRQFNAEEFADGLFTQLIEQEAVLFRLRAKVAKWRDNPSQRLGAKLEVCLKQTVEIEDIMSRLRDAAEAECKRQGMQFFNRCGVVH